MEKPSKGNIGNAGEYYFASILSSLDFITTITLGRAEKFDILAASPKNRVFKFSIKTTWESKKDFPLSVKDETGGHEDFFYVFMTLNKMESEPNYWVVPSMRVNKILKDVNHIYFNQPGKKGQKLKDVGLRKFNFKIDKWMDKNYPELRQEELNSYFKNLTQLFCIMIKQQKVKLPKAPLKTEPVLDFSEVARKIKPRRKMDVLKAREFMEKNYERA